MSPALKFQNDLGNLGALPPSYSLPVHNPLLGPEQEECHLVQNVVLNFRQRLPHLVFLKAELQIGKSNGGRYETMALQMEWSECVNICNCCYFQFHLNI